MSNPRRGAHLPLSPARKMVLELLHHAHKVPSLPLARSLDVSLLAGARNDQPNRPSWIAIFMKAYGLVSLRHPALRRAYIPWLRPHLYEHPQSECTLPIERTWQGEQVIFGGKIRAPEQFTLEQIDARLRHFKEAPVLDVNYFRQILRIGRLPLVLRRFTFWQTLYLSGYKRAKRFGTFMMSSLGSLGVEQFHPLTPLTTYFTFGPISDEGQVTAKIIYDHRVLDGRTVARCLQDLEHILNAELLLELGRPARVAA